MGLVQAHSVRAYSLLGEGNPVQTGGQFNGTGLVQETGHLADKLTTT